MENKYKLRFKFKSTGKYYPDKPYGNIFGYKVSSNLVNDYEQYDNNYISLKKSEEFTEYNTEFVALSETEYLVFDFAGFLNGYSCKAYVYDLEIIE